MVDERPSGAEWRIVAGCYLALEGVLGALSFASEDARPTVEWIAFLLLLPAAVVTVPVIYVVGAGAWNIRASMAHEPMWPVTVTFTALFVAAAAANVALLWFLGSAISRRRGRGDHHASPEEEREG